MLDRELFMKKIGVMPKVEKPIEETEGKKTEDVEEIKEVKKSDKKKKRK